MNTRRIKKNIIVSLGGQFLIMLIGLVVPRFMIKNYGSSVNGFLSTVTQIFTYLALLEAGIGSAAKNALFKPLAEQDKAGASYITSIADQYFKRITVIYGICVGVLAVVCPFVLITEVDPISVFAVVLIEGMSGVIGFYFIQTSTVVLGADGRSYINQSVNVVSQIAIYTIKIVMASLGANIILLQLAFLGLAILKAVFFQWYFRKKYAWLDFKAAPKTEKLKERGYYVINEIALTVFFATDMIVLSAGVSSALSSVYAIYNLITNSLNSVVKSVYYSLHYILGQSFHHDKVQYMKLHNGFTSLFFGGMTILMCTAYVLMLPFVRLYTAGIADVEYVYYVLPLLFCLVQMISWSTYVSSNLLWLAGYGKQVSLVSIITAAVNVILSVILVNFYGIVGVLLGTVISLPAKVVYETWASERKVLNRNPFGYLMIMGVNYLYFFAVAFVNRFIELPICDYLDFVSYGAIVFTVCTVVGVLLNIAANPDCISIIKTFRRIKKNAQR